MTRKLLVIEDDMNIQEMITDVLEDENIKIKFSATADEIETMIEHFRPDCILMDVMLPGENGDLVTCRLKSNQKYGTLPVVLMSADKELAQKMKESKADTCLHKPFDNLDLIKTINNYC